MASKRKSKKSVSKIPPKTAERVVAISLQHPELGAVRLVPLLKKQRISVSAAIVQSILRREGLQNREKRLAKLKKQTRKPKSTPKKPPARVPDNVADRIVEVSLKNPELGAVRLVPLLKKKRISVSASTIQSILRRQGLQTSEKRLAQVKKRAKKARKPKEPPKKALPKITDDVAERICEISLQNPDLGAKRLAPLLKEKGISVSSSAVYRILRHYDLHTLAKRYTKAAEITSEPVIIPKTFPEKIPPEVEDRIVEICLQNPDRGARSLLSLLEQEEILVSTSAVYRILKRNDLENRQKRLLKLEALQALEIPPEPEIEEPEPIAEAAEIEPAPAVDEGPEPVFEPAVAVSVPPVDKAPAPAEEPEPISEAVETGPTAAVDEAPEPAPEPAVTEAAEPARLERPHIRKAPIITIKKRGHWVFYPLYLLLFLLIGYLGLHAVQTIQYARLETETLTVAESVTAGMTEKTESATAAQPLDGYRQIWERNLFNTGKVKEPDPKEKIALAMLAPAKKGLGLELVGTVVADDPRLSRAIIDNRSIRKQEAYREGDSAGKVKIKKILRNNVVITTADGDELLTVEVKESGKSAPAALTQGVASQSSSAQPATTTRRSSARTSSISLKRDEVAASLADINSFMEQMPVTPYMQGEQASGFRITSIPRDSVLRKMGLRSRDVIVGIDDETITSPDQASDFFKKLADGGEVTIKLKRRRRTRQIKLNIE
jgi:type II secretion system protein C